MTAPDITPELEAGARASAFARDRYSVSTGPVTENPDIFGVLDWQGGKTAFLGSRDECKHWIDCRALAAGLEAQMPVGDVVALVGARAASPLAEGQALMLSRAKSRAAITAAIRHIIGGKS